MMKSSLTLYLILGFFEEAVGSKVYLNCHTTTRKHKGVRL